MNTNPPVDDPQLRAAQVGGAVLQKCVICGDPIGERCFCRIHRQEGITIVLCCPDCTMQYLDPKPVPDRAEQELRVYEAFIGENKPWA